MDKLWTSPLEKKTYQKVYQKLVNHKNKIQRKDMIKLISERAQLNSENTQLIVKKAFALSKDSTHIDQVGFFYLMKYVAYVQNGGSATDDITTIQKELPMPNLPRSREGSKGKDIGQIDLLLSGKLAAESTEQTDKTQVKADSFLMTSDDYQIQHIHNSQDAVKEEEHKMNESNDSENDSCQLESFILQSQIIDLGNQRENDSLVSEGLQTNEQRDLNGSNQERTNNLFKIEISHQSEKQLEVCQLKSKGTNGLSQQAGVISNEDSIKLKDAIQTNKKEENVKRSYLSSQKNGISQEIEDKDEQQTGIFGNLSSDQKKDDMEEMVEISLELSCVTSAFKDLKEEEKLRGQVIQVGNRAMTFGAQDAQLIREQMKRESINELDKNTEQDKQLIPQQLQYRKDSFGQTYETFSSGRFQFSCGEVSQVQKDSSVVPISFGNDQSRVEYSDPRNEQPNYFREQKFGQEVESKIYLEKKGNSVEEALSAHFESNGFNHSSLNHQVSVDSVYEFGTFGTQTKEARLKYPQLPERDVSNNVDEEEEEENDKKLLKSVMDCNEFSKNDQNQIKIALDLLKSNREESYLHKSKLCREKPKKIVHITNYRQENENFIKKYILFRVETKSETGKIFFVDRRYNHFRSLHNYFENSVDYYGIIKPQLPSKNMTSLGSYIGITQILLRVRVRRE